MVLFSIVARLLCIKIIITYFSPLVCMLFSNTVVVISKAYGGFS